MSTVLSLGRVPNPPDPRDANYPLSLITATAEALPASSRWVVNGWLDQGSTPHCVAYAGAHEQIAEPTPRVASADDAERWYAACKAIDGSPGDGTYDRALMKVWQAEGRVSAYHWAASAEELRRYVLTTGPVLVGTNWYEGMFTLDKDGLIHPTGKVAGGHEYLIIGYQPIKVKGFLWRTKTVGAYLIRNSWGFNWGLAGNAYILASDLNRLVFVEGGDACAAVDA